MRKLLGTAALAAGLVMTPALLPAQGLEFAALYTTLSGDDFDGVNAGIGLDGQIRFSAGPRLTIGLGGQYTSHGTDLTGSPKFKVLGIFAEPRLTFSMPGSSMTPFVGARVGYLRNSITAGANEQKASGYMAGLTGGLTFRAAPKINLVLAAMFAMAKFGDVDVNGTTVADSDASGNALALRGGVIINLR